jgi:peptidoglycan/xylan/chitin deacetylase (PgdA/CDA1 family)
MMKKVFAILIITLVCVLVAASAGACIFIAGFTAFDKASDGYANAASAAYPNEEPVSKGNENISQSSLGDLTVLMYHNTLARGKKQSVYCINQENLRRDFEYLKQNGYNVISFKRLTECVDNGVYLPDKAVLLTFDDGYLNNVKYALPLLEEYGYSGLFSVVGDYTKFDRYGGKGGGDFIYLGWKDIGELADNDNVEIGLHSYDLHNTRPRLGMSQLKGESDEAYAKLVADDTQKLIDKLAAIGVTTDIFAYPFGKYTKLSEAVLKDKGISITLTCNEGINHIYGRRSLYLLKRINRDATKSSLSEILKKYS